MRLGDSLKESRVPIKQVNPLDLLYILQTLHRPYHLSLPPLLDTNIIVYSLYPSHIYGRVYTLETLAFLIWYSYNGSIPLERARVLDV